MSEALPERFQPLDVLLDSLDAMVAYWDQDQRCRYANKAYVDWFGIAPETMMGMRLQDLLGPLYARNLPYIEGALAGQRQVFERAITTPTGQVRESLATYTPHIADGRVVGFCVHVADVTVLKKLERDLRHAKQQAEQLAAHDPLTGLLNRAPFSLWLEGDGAEVDAPCALLLVDLDDFKRINDGFGHAAGDRYLVELGERLRSCVRDDDRVFRIGGDEFAVVADDCGSERSAVELAERILRAVARPVEGLDALPAPSASIGVACIPLHRDTRRAAFAYADAALYQAKGRGKNRCSTQPLPTALTD